MNTKRLALILAVVVFEFAAPARAANVLVSGNSMDNSNTDFTSRLSTLGHVFQFVTTGAFQSTSTAGFDVIWLDGFSNYGNSGGLNLKLTSFVTAGGKLLVQNPGFGTENIADYPLGSQLGAIYTIPPGENFVRLVNPSHPLNAGLTGTGFNGWNASAAGYFEGSSGPFTVLADNGSASQFITLNTTLGQGSITYTELLIAERLSRVTDAQALAFLNNVILVPEPGTWVLLALGAACLARRRKGSSSAS